MPIKDASGDIGVSGISRDISEKSFVEKELIRKNQELSRLFFIGSAMRSTLDLEKLLRMILTAVTMSDGLGFNRAVLFLLDEERSLLKGVMGVGPASHEEAGRIWEELSLEQRTLSGIMDEIDSGPLKKDSFLDKLSLGIEISLDSDLIITRSVKEKRPFNVGDARNEPFSDAILVQQLGTEAYAVVPLISRDRVIGVLWVDNLFNKRPITEEDMRFLTSFSNQIAAAIESAKLFEQESSCRGELENMFRSISDMVYITDGDYNIKNINKAVVERMGLSEEIIEEVLRSSERRAPHTCPHHKQCSQRRRMLKRWKMPHWGTF